MAALKIGDKAPNFTLNNQDGQEISLQNFIGKKTVVLYFYPKNETPGCTAEACSFRDSYEQFTDLGAEVIGVSADSTSSHKKFTEKRRLPFQLLSDPSHKVSKAYGVKGLFGLIPGRVTFVLDKEGLIQHRFESQLNIDRHIKDALQIVRKLSAEKA